MKWLSDYHKRVVELTGDSILLLLFATPIIFKIYWEIFHHMWSLLGVHWPPTDLAVGLGTACVCLALSLHHTFELLERIHN